MIFIPIICFSKLLVKFDENSLVDVDKMYKVFNYQHSSCSGVFLKYSIIFLKQVD